MINTTEIPPMMLMYQGKRADLSEYPVNLKFDRKVNHKNYLPDNHGKFVIPKAKKAKENFSG
jgi:hypothetical protein